ncbi:MAG: PQQ-dependent sugar dehydrogenase [Chloroflexota bacterium]|nr:PQQ-dependent sugar dehydrogenase [Chloroflexota bacterium]
MHAHLGKLGALALLLLALPFPALVRPALAQPDDLVIELPEGYQIEKVVDGLTYPTALTWDDEGQMYVAEAGGAFLDLDAPARILSVDVDNGEAEELVNLTDAGIAASVPGLFWHDGAFYFTHRNAEDRTGAVSRVTPEGEVTPIFSGIVDSQAEHQVNDVRMGPDGRMYVASGPAGNAAVVGLDLVPFLMQSPDLHTTPCEDIVLTGRNYMTPDFRTEDDPSDLVMTGAYVPFGTETTPGQTIEGITKCGGAILTFDPESDNPEETLEVYAWGFRNIIGLTWDDDGTMYAGVNGYDIRGSRPVRDELDATYRIEEGAWYGWPDFSAAFEPLTDPAFDVPNSLQPPSVIDGQPQPKDQVGFVIDHEASGLEPPDASLIAGRHPWNSSPSMLDVAPESWGEFAGQLFVAEWGDLAPPTNPLRDEPVGYRVVRINPESGEVLPFAQNAMPGPASEQMAMGMGLERPFDVKFGPDGAMYIVDYGVARINPASEGTPYEFPPETGAIWRVIQTDGEAATPDTDGGDETAASEEESSEATNVVNEILTPEATRTEEATPEPAS